LKPTATKNNIITVTEAAEILCVTVGTIRKWCHYKRMPYYKFGGKSVRFKRDELERWIQTRAVPEKR
jgi:excisionase family DNA binding protein